MSSTSAQPGNEREHMLEMLKRNADVYLEAVKEIPEPAATVKPDANSWSAVELAEHVAVGEHGMLRLMEMAVPKTTAVQYERDEWVKQLLSDRTQKANAPARAVPTGRWKTLKEAADAFRQARHRTLEFASDPAKDLRTVEIEHPLFGTLDGYQMLMVMSGHVERHLKQLEEIKNSPEYRKAAGI